MAETTVQEGAQLPQGRNEFRRETITPYLIGDAIAKIKGSGALLTDLHFVHHQLTGDEFHSTTWFDARALFWDPSVIMSIAPAMLHKLEQIELDKIDIVAGVVTGGVALMTQIVQVINSDRRGGNFVKCLFLTHKGDEDYELSQGDLGRLKQWIDTHGRSPNCLLLDDVDYSGRTKICCFAVLQNHKCKVTSTLHVAQAEQKEHPLLKGVVSGALYPFPPGPMYDKYECPMCWARKSRTIV